MRKKEVLAAIGASPLPRLVKDYFVRASGAARGSALKGGLKKDPAAFLKSLHGLLSSAGKILGRPAQEVLFITGFNPNDLAPERFAAALAELRAVLFLDGEGFSGLKFMPQAEGLSADISGVKDGQLCVFEVCCLRSGGLLPAAGLLGGKYEKKKRQLNNARKKLACGLFFAADPLALLEPADAAALKELARALHAEKKGPAGTHICLLSGAAGAVFPPWG